jgi:hypothetical protein
VPRGMASVARAAFRFRRRAGHQKPPMVSMSKRPAWCKVAGSSARPASTPRVPPSRACALGTQMAELETLGCARGFHGPEGGAASVCRNSSTCSRSPWDKLRNAFAAVSPSPA